MRILVLNYEFPPVGGGGGRAAHKLARQWAGIAHVDYLTTRAPGQAPREVVDGINVHRVSVPGRSSLQVASHVSMLCYPPFGLVRALGLVRLGRYDVINTHFAVPSGPLGSALKLLAHAPNVLSVHGGDIYDPSKPRSPHLYPPLRAAVRAALRHADAIVAQSRNTSENVIEYHGAELASKMRIVPLPFDPPPESVGLPEPKALRAGLGLDVNGRYLVSVGRLIKRKAFDRLVLALESLPADVQLILVGEGPERGELERLAQAHRLTQRVHMMGQVSERDKYRCLAAADLYVLSSLHEGFGIMLQEAMAVGLPIVATSHGGQTDVVTHKENGLLVDSGEPEDLAAAACRLFADPELRAAMSRANLLKVQQYSEAKTAERYLAIFSQVMGREWESC